MNQKVRKLVRSKKILDFEETAQQEEKSDDEEKSKDELELDPHQIQARDNWIKNDFCGLVK